jgi:hypothetical protein
MSRLLWDLILSQCRIAQNCWFAMGVLVMSVAPPEGGQNRVMIYGPKADGTYIVEFKTADGEALAIGVPAGEPLGLTISPGVANAAQLT